MKLFCVSLSSLKRNGNDDTQGLSGRVAIAGFDRRMSSVWKNTSACEPFGTGSLVALSGQAQGTPRHPQATTAAHRPFRLPTLKQLLLLRSLLCQHRDYLLHDILAPHLLHPGLVRTHLNIDGNRCRSGLRS